MKRWLVALALFSVVFAEYSHPLSQVNVDEHLEMEGWNITGVDELNFTPEKDSFVHFAENSAGDGFSLYFRALSDEFQVRGGAGHPGGQSAHLTIQRDSGDATVSGELLGYGSLTVDGNVSVDSGTLFLDSTHSRVGVGNSGPNRKLQVSGGDVRIESGYGLYLDSGGATRLYNSADKLAVRAEITDGVAEFTSYGLNLPLSSPTYNLQMAGSLKLGDSEEASLDISSEVHLTSSGTSYMTGGNLGIGTSTPTATLDVRGELKSVVNGVEYYPVPSGSIVIWSGAIADIPTGWALCDGTQGTPDLTDRFVQGVGPGEEPGETGGSPTILINETEMPSHGHSVSTSSSAGDHSHSGTAGSGGSHDHSVQTHVAGDHSHTASFDSENHHQHVFTVSKGPAGSIPVLQGFADPNNCDLTDFGSDHYLETTPDHTHVFSVSGSDHTHEIDSVDDAPGHTHSITVENTESVHTHDFTTDSIGGGESYSNNPAYYRLAFIMKL